MRTFCNLLRPDDHYRRGIFDAGLQRHGYRATEADRCDLLLIWNRFGFREQMANAAEARGALVLVAENATWGNGFAGDRWYSLWRGVHNVAPERIGGCERWDGLGVELAPWRAAGGEIVGLPQRGIGPKGVAMPRGWTPPGCTRVRPHPGTRPCKPLQDDLAHASEVRTWGSGAAVLALLWGIPVRSWMPQWVAEQDNNDAGRLAMFRRLAWSQWTHAEIESGEAFAWMF